MDMTAFASPVSVIFAIKPGASHAGLSLCTAKGRAEDGKMPALSVALSGKGRDGRASPVLLWAWRGAFPLAPLGSAQPWQAAQTLT